MNAFKAARRVIELNPESKDARILSRLAIALAESSPHPLSELYELEYDHFELAVSMIREWRLDRYYAGRLKLFDVSLQLRQIASH